MGIPYFTGTELPFVASIVIGTIQLGATIDYAILITTKYIENRKSGIEIFTNSKRVVESRKKTIELILSNHRMDCLSCVRSGNCELLALARANGVDDTKYQGAKTESKIDDSSVHLIRDNSKCVLWTDIRSKTMIVYSLLADYPEKMLTFDKFTVFLCPFWELAVNDDLP